MLAIGLSLAIVIGLFRHLQTAADAIRSVKGTDMKKFPINPHSGTIAICVTGQVARLELLSKIRNIVLPYLEDGHTVRMYVYLDSEADDVGQTMWKFNYSNTPFIRYTAGDLYSYIWSAAREAADKRHWHAEQKQNKTNIR